MSTEKCGNCGWYVKNGRKCGKTGKHTLKVGGCNEWTDING